MPDDKQATGTPAVRCDDVLCLFVGGPKDGEVIAIQPHLQTVHFLRNDTDPHHVYWREHLGAQDHIRTIFRHESLTMPQLLDALIDGYAPKPVKKTWCGDPDCRICNSGCLDRHNA